MERCAPKALVASMAAADMANVLRSLGYEPVCVPDGVQALRMCGEDTPDIVVADAILPSLDGFALAKRIRALRLRRMPGIIVMHLPGMGRRLDMPGCAVLEKPAEAGEIRRELEFLAVENRVQNGEGSEKIGRILDLLGVPVHPGREYLADAAFLAGEDTALLMRLTEGLYPMVAARAGTDANAVERAMRRVIDAAWGSGNIEEQYRIFRNTIDAARGKPTCGEMIAQLTEMLRREG